MIKIEKSEDFYAVLKERNLSFKDVIYEAVSSSDSGHTYFKCDPETKSVHAVRFTNYDDIDSVTNWVSEWCADNQGEVFESASAAREKFFDTFYEQIEEEWFEDEMDEARYDLLIAVQNYCLNTLSIDIERMLDYEQPEFLDDIIDVSGYYFDYDLDASVAEARMKIDLIVAVPGEANLDFASNNRFLEALLRKVHAPKEFSFEDQEVLDTSSLYWLAKTQYKTDLDILSGLDSFTKSMKEEINETCYSLNAVTILATISFSEWCELVAKDGKMFTIPKDAVCGLFDSWNGSGGMLDIKLENPFNINSSMVHRVFIEDVKNPCGYTVDEVYGLIPECWNTRLEDATYPMNFIPKPSLPFEAAKAASEAQEPPAKSEAKEQVR